MLSRKDKKELYLIAKSKYTKNKKYRKKYHKKWRTENKGKLLQYRIDNKEKDKERLRVYFLKNYSKVKEWLENIRKKSQCEICGYFSLEYPLIEFHHKTKNKKFGITNSVIWNKRYSKQEVRNEMKKCMRLCPICHKILHYKERNNVTTK